MRRILAALTALTPLFTSCSDAEIVGLHIDLAADGSGTLTARALQPGADAGPAESTSGGIAWQTRAALVTSQGTFEDIGDVTFGEGELRFLMTKSPDMPGLRVLIRRDPELKWVKQLAPDAEQRRALARLLDPTGRTREVADSVRLELQLPNVVISSGYEPPARGMEASHERNRAYLILPISSLLEAGEDLAWAVNWK